MAYITQRGDTPEAAERLLRLHDGGKIFQFLLLIPVVVGLVRLSGQQSFGLGQATLVTGLGALLLGALCLALNFPGIVWDALYMFPQGIFGGWLIVTNWKMAGLLPRWLRWAGVLVGLGLVLVGLFPPGYALLVDPVCLRIPVVLEDFPTDFSPANAALHRMLLVGSYLGVATLPLWSALLGWSLLRRR